MQQLFWLSCLELIAVYLAILLDEAEYDMQNYAELCIVVYLKQLLDEAEYDLQNYADLGGWYPPKPKA